MDYESTQKFYFNFTFQILIGYRFQNLWNSIFIIGHLPLSVSIKHRYACNAGVNRKL